MMMAQMSSQYAQKMRREWDERARRNARHYIADGQTEWSDAEFWASGEATVAQDILTDMVKVGGRSADTIHN